MAAMQQLPRHEFIPHPMIVQLKAGARLVIPVGFSYSYQELMAVEKKASGELET